MQFEGLMKHQQEGAEWLAAHPRAMLAWDMRVGKTPTALRAWENTARGPMLVLCPATARENWRREALRFAIDPDFPPNVQVLSHHSIPINPAADIIITNYDKLSQPQLIRRLRNNCERRRWDTLILDEAHRLKSPGAERTKLVLGGGRKDQTPLVQLADRVWELTGTPMPNHPAELWTHCYHLFPEAIQYHGRPMELWEFELQYCKLAPSDYGQKMRVVGGKNLHELRDRLTPFVHRLKYEDVFGLGSLPQIDTWPLDTGVTTRFPDVPELVAELTQRYGKISDIELFDAIKVDAYLATINNYHDALASLRKDTGTLKAVAVSLLLREQFEDLGLMPKTIVFAWHHEAIDTLKKGLKAFNPVVIDGTIPPGARREEAIERFSNDDTCRVFIGQIKTAGEAIDLSAAEQIVFAEHSWVPGENAQALMRASGPRQTKPVWVRFTYLPGSVDENVCRAIARKTAIIQQVFG